MKDKQIKTLAPNSKLHEVPQEQRQQALERFNLLKPFFEEGVTLTQIANQHNIALRTIQRWAALYHKHGLSGLVRKPRIDYGQPRRYRAEIKLLIEGLALKKPAPTITFIYRQMVTIAQEKGWNAPNYKFVHKIVKNLDPALLTMAHKGSKAYRNSFDLIYRHQASRPNEIWQADHCLLDIWLLDDKKQPARPLLTVIMDDYSRAIAGFSVGFHSPSAFNTALVLRHAIWRKASPKWHICGIPEIFYTDHGSDFTSKHLEQVSADLKMQLIFSEVAMPRGRGKIERFFHTINQLFLCSLPGFTPQSSPPATAKLTLPVFEGLLQKFILDEYHLRPHGEIDCQPQARWEENGFVPQLPESLEQLDLLLLTVAKTRRVRQDGIFFQGLRYLDPALIAYVGEDVVIRYDPRDLAEIRVYHENIFICRAVNQALAGHTVGLKEIVQIRNQRRKRLKDDVNQRTTLVDTLIEARQSDSYNLEQLIAQSKLERKPVNKEDSSTKASRPNLKRYYHE